MLLNTCWSGDGGQELAAVIGQTVADSLPAEQTRSMVIISSARREESVDGAFLSSILSVLHSHAPPPGLGPEHVWAASDRYLTPERLCAAVNILLRPSNHQAQLFTVYGVVGDFFRRANLPVKAAELPPGVIDRLRSDFPDQLSVDPGPWTAAHLSAAIEQHAASEKTGELAYRLNRLAVGVAALELLEGWLGTGRGTRQPPSSGLAVGAAAASPDSTSLWSDSATSSRSCCMAGRSRSSSSLPASSTTPAMTPVMIASTSGLNESWASTGKQ